MLRVVCLSHSRSTRFRKEIGVDLTISAEFRLSQDREFRDPRDWDKLRCDAIAGVKNLWISCNLFETKTFCFLFEAIQSKTT